MSIQRAVGHFTRPASAGTNTVVTGLSFQPTCVIFLTSHALTAGTWRAEAKAGIAVVAPRTSGTVFGETMRVFGNDANATPVGIASIANSTGVLSLSNGTVAQNQVTSISLDASGFTIDWSATNYDGEQELIGYLALGGDVKAVWVPFNAVPGATTLGQTLTLPFEIAWQPCGAFLFAVNATTQHSASVGVVGSDLGQWALAQSA